MKSLIASLFCVAASLHISASAETIQFQCSDLKGYTYYSAEGLVTDENSGWAEDSITGGQFVIDFDTATVEVDYRFKDATGKWYSPSEDGGETMLLSVDETDFSIQFITLYPASNAVEVYTVTEIREGSASLQFSNSRNNSMASSAKLMVGDCTVH